MKKLEEILQTNPKIESLQIKFKKKIPEQITALRNLKQLSLMLNSIEQLPEIFHELELDSLQIYAPDLKVFPQELFKHPSLKTLTIGQSQFEVLALAPL
jgi:Leucine-rich repeat (LRR) protein